MTTPNHYYNIGYRDALAVLCANARAKGIDETFREAAETLLKHDPDHPHAKWVLQKTRIAQNSTGAKLRIAVAFEVTVQGQTIWWPPTGKPFFVGGTELTDSEMKVIEPFIRQGKCEVREHLSLDILEWDTPIAKECAGWLKAVAEMSEDEIMKLGYDKVYAAYRLLFAKPEDGGKFAAVPSSA